MLKEHYLTEDWPQVLDNIQVMLDGSVALLNMAENAEFSSKTEHIAKIKQAADIVHALNRKKIDRDIDSQANEYLRRYMF